MLLDDKGRLFGKLSVIDLFIAVAVGLVVIIGIFRFGGNSYAGARGEEQLLQLKFYKESLEDFTVDAVAIGGKVMADNNEIGLGTIVDVLVGESIEYNPSDDGRIVASPMEGYSSIEITTEVMGQLYNGSALINDNLYSTGSEIIIRAGKSKIILKISDVSAV